MYCRSRINCFSLLLLFVSSLSCMLFSEPVSAGPLDDYYLAQFSVQKTGSAFVKSTALEPATEEPAHCGTPLKHGLQRDWGKLEATTQKVLAKQLAAPVLSGVESTLLSQSGKFLIHYTTSGTDAVPSFAWVETVAQTFDYVAAAYVVRGWRLAPTVSAAPYDIYLRDLAPLRYYGLASSSQAIPSPDYPNAFGSFMEIDNNFTDSIYVNSSGGPYSATQSLQITAAHEYHHAIQYGYNYFFDIWYAESTATWQEDELYEGVNQLYNYVPGWINNSSFSLDIPASTTTGGGYGRWIFSRYLAEQHGADVVRTVWNYLASLNSPGGNADIPMLPVLETHLLAAPVNSSLAADFFGFAKRVYLKDWTSHVGDVSRIPHAFPLGTYYSYPLNPAPSVVLPHYSFAYYRFTPEVIDSSSLSINISGSGTISAAVFKKAGGVITEITPDASGKVFIISGFSTLDPVADEVVLLLANITAADNQSASFTASMALNRVDLLFGGSGGGDVNGSMNCSSGQTCVPKLFDINSVVTLLASPNKESLFDNWSGNCAGSGECKLTMDTDKTVVANFSYVKPARINGLPALPFDTLAGAYQNAITGDTIQARLFDFASQTGLILGRNVNISIKGGYNAAYSSNPDLTTIQGPLVLQSGAVTVEGLAIR